MREECFNPRSQNRDLGHPFGFERLRAARGKASMSVLDVLRKGFGYVLMSMGVSSPVAKKAVPKPAGKPEPGEKSGS
jgi:hypothetical protein